MTFAALLENTYVTGFLTIFFIVYGSLARPELSERAARVFENTFFRLFVLFLIAYMANKNIQVSIIVAVAFMITMNMVSEKRITEAFQNN